MQNPRTLAVLRIACVGAFFLILTSKTFHAQTLDQLSSTVVLLTQHEQHRVRLKEKYVLSNITKLGTGFFIQDEAGNLFLVTARHVASDMKADATVILRGANDMPIRVPIKQLTGKTTPWILHEKEDVAVLVLHPDASIMFSLQSHFSPKKIFATDTAAPSRDRPVTTLGFPLGLGSEGHFSPISRDSRPASGLVTLLDPNTRKPAVFFLLDNPSIGGFSGAPLFLLPTPYAADGALMFPDRSAGASCVGLITGTISDETGGKMGAVTPSSYVVETLNKATPTKN